MKRMWIMDFWTPTDGKKSPVIKELDHEHAGNSQAERVFVQLLSAVETYGPGLKLPHNRNLGEGLFELRNRGHGKRYYYTETDFSAKDENGEARIILLLGAVGGKSNKSEQQRDIERARKRLQACMKENIPLLQKGERK